MAEIATRGCRFHVQRLGEQGERVVLIHGVVWDNLSSWYFTLAPHLARVGRVLMYDARGLIQTPFSAHGIEIGPFPEDSPELRLSYFSAVEFVRSYRPQHRFAGPSIDFGSKLVGFPWEALEGRRCVMVFFRSINTDQQGDFLQRIAAAFADGRYHLLIGGAVDGVKSPRVLSCGPGSQCSTS